MLCPDLSEALLRAPLPLLEALGDAMVKVAASRTIGTLNEVLIRMDEREAGKSFGPRPVNQRDQAAEEDLHCQLARLTELFPPGASTSAEGLCKGVAGFLQMLDKVKWHVEMKRRGCNEKAIKLQAQHKDMLCEYKRLDPESYQAKALKRARAVAREGAIQERKARVKSAFNARTKQIEPTTPE